MFSLYVSPKKPNRWRWSDRNWVLAITTNLYNPSRFPMSKLFDDVAGKFACDIDAAMNGDNYIRGKIFVALAQEAIPAGGYILDYGCGPGRLSLLLARSGFRVRGADTSKGMVAQARALDRSALSVDFETIEKSDEVLLPNTYDAIVCSSVIEYVPKADELLKGFHQALRKSGVLIISYANKSSLWRQHWNRVAAENPMGPSQHHVWNEQEFEALLAHNGFHAITRPKFFESPSDRWPWGVLFRNSPYVGSLGVIVARASSMTAS